MAYYFEHAVCSHYDIALTRWNAALKHEKRVDQNDMVNVLSPNVPLKDPCVFRRVLEYFRAHPCKILRIYIYGKMENSLEIIKLLERMRLGELRIVQFYIFKGACVCMRNLEKFITILQKYNIRCDFVAPGYERVMCDSRVLYLTPPLEEDVRVIHECIKRSSLSNISMSEKLFLFPWPTDAQIERAHVLVDHIRQRHRALWVVQHGMNWKNDIVHVVLNVNDGKTFIRFNPFWYVETLGELITKSFNHGCDVELELPDVTDMLRPFLSYLNEHMSSILHHVDGKHVIRLSSYPAQTIDRLIVSNLHDLVFDLHRDVITNACLSTRLCYEKERVLREHGYGWTCSDRAEFEQYVRILVYYVKNSRERLHDLNRNILRSVPSFFCKRVVGETMGFPIEVSVVHKLQSGFVEDVFRYFKDTFNLRYIDGAFMVSFRTDENTVLHEVEEFNNNRSNVKVQIIFGSTIDGILRDEPKRMKSMPDTK